MNIYFAQLLKSLYFCSLIMPMDHAIFIGFFIFLKKSPPKACAN